MNAPFQLFDALPAHIEDALRASIERFGVLVPVVKDQHGNVLDGHHRARIADQLGVPYRVDVVQVADEDEAREIARTRRPGETRRNGDGSSDFTAYRIADLPDEFVVARKLPLRQVAHQGDAA